MKVICYNCDGRGYLKVYFSEAVLKVVCRLCRGRGYLYRRER